MRSHQEILAEELLEGNGALTVTAFWQDHVRISWII